MYKTCIGHTEFGWLQSDREVTSIYTFTHLLEMYKCMHLRMYSKINRVNTCTLKKEEHGMITLTGAPHAWTVLRKGNTE